MTREKGQNCNEEGLFFSFFSLTKSLAHAPIPFLLSALFP